MSGPSEKQDIEENRLMSKAEFRSWTSLGKQVRIMLKIISRHYRKILMSNLVKRGTLVTKRSHSKM